jgi:hypothetical protein
MNIVMNEIKNKNDDEIKIKEDGLGFSEGIDNKIMGNSETHIFLINSELEHTKLFITDFIELIKSEFNEFIYTEIFHKFYLLEDYIKNISTDISISENTFQDIFETEIFPLIHKNKTQCGLVDILDLMLNQFNSTNIQLEQLVPIFNEIYTIFYNKEYINNETDNETDIVKSIKTFVKKLVNKYLKYLPSARNYLNEYIYKQYIEFSLAYYQDKASKKHPGSINIKEFEKMIYTNLTKLYLNSQKLLDILKTETETKPKKEILNKGLYLKLQIFTDNYKKSLKKGEIADQMCVKYEKIPLNILDYFNKYVYHYHFKYYLIKTWLSTYMNCNAKFINKAYKIIPPACFNDFLVNFETFFPDFITKIYVNIKNNNINKIHKFYNELKIKTIDYKIVVREKYTINDFNLNENGNIIIKYINTRMKNDTEQIEYKEYLHLLNKSIIKYDKTIIDSYDKQSGINRKDKLKDLYITEYSIKEALDKILGTISDDNTIFSRIKNLAQLKSKNLMIFLLLSEDELIEEIKRIEEIEQNKRNKEIERIAKIELNAENKRIAEIERVAKIESNNANADKLRRERNKKAYAKPSSMRNK